jgi:hypothetical protein
MADTAKVVYDAADAAFRQLLADLSPQSPLSPLHSYPGSIHPRERQQILNQFAAHVGVLAVQYAQKLEQNCRARGFSWRGAEEGMRNFLQMKAQRAKPYLEKLIDEHNRRVAASPPSPGKKRKRSTERGEARIKIIAALTKHHSYADGSCLNQDPIGNNELARMAGVAESTASSFFTKEFKGRSQYQAACRDVSLLVAMLKVLNSEFSPHHLYGRTPPGEGGSPEDE